MSDPLRDLRWARRAERTDGRRSARTAARLGFVLVAISVAVRLLIRSGVSYNWLQVLRELESHLVAGAFLLLLYAFAGWWGTRHTAPVFYRPSIARDAVFILVTTTVVVGIVVGAMWLLFM